MTHPLTPAEAAYLDRITVRVILDGHIIRTADFKLSELEPGGTVDIKIAILPVYEGKKKRKKGA